MALIKECFTICQSRFWYILRPVHYYSPLTEYSKGKKPPTLQTLVMCSHPWDKCQTKAEGPAGMWENQCLRTPAAELLFGDISIALKEVKSQARAWVRVSLSHKEKSGYVCEFMCLSQLPDGLQCGLEHLERAEMSEWVRGLENCPILGRCGKHWFLCVIFR